MPKNSLRSLPPYLAFVVEQTADNGGTGDGEGGNSSSTSTAEAGQSGDGDGEGGQTDPPAKTFTEDEVARIVEERLARDRRARARKAKPAPPKAETEGDEGGQGEQDNAAAELERRLAELEAERDAARAEATRASVAEAKAVPAGLLAGPADGTKEALEAWADQLIEWRGQAPRRGPSSPAIGRTNGEAATDAPVGTGPARIRHAYASSK